MNTTTATETRIADMPVGTAIEVAPNSKARALAQQYGGEPQPTWWVRATAGWTQGCSIEPAGQTGVAQIFRGPFLDSSVFELSEQEGTITVLGQFSLIGD